MILPELLLIGGALAGLGGPLRLWSEEGEVLIPESNFPGLDVLFFDLARRASGKFATVWSLEVAELEHYD